jgi:hypothetical protein
LPARHDGRFNPNKRGDNFPVGSSLHIGRTGPRNEVSRKPDPRIERERFRYIPTKIKKKLHKIRLTWPQTSLEKSVDFQLNVDILALNQSADLG